MKKLRVFSSMQPSGDITIGNYIGALRQWINIQDKYECMYSIADLHAITTKKNMKNLNEISLNTLAIYLACGIDPNKSIIFKQSQLYEHTQLNWILNCYTYFNELKLMHQFKNRLNIYKENINIGILNYPVLMTADILLYQTNIVPIGEDQKQHIELTIKIAKKFNLIHNSNIFVIPKPLFSKSGSRIMSLLNPTKKMSKSDNNTNNIITLLENPKSIIKKIKHAITDSDIPPIINYNKINKPGISNLLNIFSGITDIPINELENKFKGKMYNFFKKNVAEIIIEKLILLQKKYYILRSEENYLNQILKEGSKKAKLLANNTINKVYKAIGLKNK